MSIVAYEPMSSSLMGKPPKNKKASNILARNGHSNTTGTNTILTACAMQGFEPCRTDTRSVSTMNSCPLSVQRVKEYRDLMLTAPLPIRAQQQKHRGYQPPMPKVRKKTTKAVTCGQESPRSDACHMFVYKSGQRKSTMILTLAKPKKCSTVTAIGIRTQEAMKITPK